MPASPGILGILGTVINRARHAPESVHGAACCPRASPVGGCGSTMHRLRSYWLALVGGLLLVGLSVSSVFAARPSATEDGTRGQQIAAFVHELVFGSTDEEETPDETQDQTEEEDQVQDDEQLEEDQEDVEESDEDASEDVEESDTEASSHGQCVSEEASDKSDEDYQADPEFTNHGAFVSYAARVTCWQTGDEEEATDEEDAVLDSGAEITSPDDTDSTGAAELSAKEQRKADRDAAKAERKAAKSKNGHGGGNGNGHGHGG